MELGGMVFVQVLIIFILMLLGFVLVKTRMMDEKTTSQMTNVVLSVVIPCVLIDAYQKEFTKELAAGLFLSALLALITHIIGIVISTLIFRKEDTLRYRINIFSSVYSNCGFMAIPLLSSTLGTDGVFYGSAYLAIFTILAWTHGICLYQGDVREIPVRKILLNPGIIGVTVAIILFVLGIKLPYIINESVEHLAALNTPMGMMLTGAYLTKVDFKKAFKNVSLYVVAFLRLILIPVIALITAKLMRLDPVAVKAVFISAACPTASIAALFASRYKLDAAYATELVAVTTLFSVVTIPLVMILY